METKQICDCISFIAMCIADKEHDAQFKRESLNAWVVANNIDNDVAEHMRFVLHSCLREE